MYELKSPLWLLEASTRLRRDPLGTLAIDGSERGLTQIDLLPVGKTVPVSAPEPASVVAKAARQLEEYFNGRRREFDLPLDYETGGFERQVLSALARVPYGKTVSYGELAGMAGSPRAARAVGTSCARIR